MQKVLSLTLKVYCLGQMMFLKEKYVLQGMGESFF